MKKISFVVASLVVASSAIAGPARVCDAYTNAQDGTQIGPLVGFTAASGGAVGFVLNAFKPKCSANVYASVEQNEIALGVAAGSKKGKNMFTGGTGGGGVKPVGQGNYPTGVVAGETEANATLALAAAVSS